MRIRPPQAPPGDGRRAGRRYGWVALAGAVTIAVVVLVTQVAVDPVASPDLDPSFVEAEQRRFETLRDLGGESGAGHPSYDVAEQNRSRALTDMEDPLSIGHPSFEVAERNRFRTLAESDSA